MNKDETLALFAQGKDAWNAWAETMLAEKAAMEKAGTWAAERSVRNDELEPRNDATQLWMARARADFSGVSFENDGVRTDKSKHNVSMAMDPLKLSFPGEANFREAEFRTGSGLADVEFLGDVSFERARFTEAAFFNRSTFAGIARFDGATFSKDASIGEATFLQWATFKDVRFDGDAWFVASRFVKSAWFDEATVKGNATFTAAVFENGAWFDRATILGRAEFDKATFLWGAEFGRCTFSRFAAFREAMFSGDAHFAGAKFHEQAHFQKSRFDKLAGFAKITFEGDARFDNAIFSGMAGFGGVTFEAGAAFDRARFQGPAGFAQSVYEGFASFEDARFEKAASFAAIYGRERSTFSMRGATFLEVPDFEQAHFAEAPRLDVSAIRHRRGTADTLQPVRQSEIGGDPSAPQDHALVKSTDTTARWRALKRLAVQGHDHEREQIFFAEEVKSLRGTEDFALPRPQNLFRRGQSVWPGGARFWLGWAYQLFSDFGRSIMRPLVWWTAVTGLFALVYLGQHLAHRPDTRSGLMAWTAAKVLPASAADRLGLGTPATLSCVAGKVSEPATSSLYLATTKGALFAGLGGSDKLAQAYACLYGIDESYGKLHEQQLIPVIPDAVVLWSLLQTVLSAALLFLFMLAVRNHFRIR